MNTHGPGRRLAWDLPTVRIKAYGQTQRHDHKGTFKIKEEKKHRAVLSGAQTGRDGRYICLHLSANEHRGLARLPLRGEVEFTTSKWEINSPRL